MLRWLPVNLLHQAPPLQSIIIRTRAQQLCCNASAKPASQQRLLCAFVAMPRYFSRSYGQITHAYRVETICQRDNWLPGRRWAPVRVQASAHQVVATREKGKNAKLINALKKHNIICLELPLIEHAPGPDRYAINCHGVQRLPQLAHRVAFHAPSNVFTNTADVSASSAVIICITPARFSAGSCCLRCSLSSNGTGSPSRHQRQHLCS